MAGPSQLEVELEFLRQDPTTLERWGGLDLVDLILASFTVSGRVTGTYGSWRNRSSSGFSVHCCFFFLPGNVNGSNHCTLASQ